jgi:protein pelota
MKLLERNDKQGTVAVLAQTLEDLWELHQLIEAGDTCTGSSEYKEKIGAGTEGKTQIAKHRVTVELAVERTEFAKHSAQLRVTGKVTGGSEAVPRGSYHSIDVAAGDRITIRKMQWHEYQRERLEDALRGSVSAVIVIFDREQAIICKLTPTGHETLATLKGDVPRKGVDEAKQHTFYRDIVTQLAEIAARTGAQQVIAASPSFWKEYLEKELTQELRRITTFTSVSTVDTSAINEILTRPELQTALKEQRGVRELHLLGEILEALAKDKLVYGTTDVEQALQEGNASTVVVSEHALGKAREEGTFERLEGLMQTASSIKANLRIVSTDDVATKIDGLGGIVAVKRW